jgi:hypothetical protein
MITGFSQRRGLRCECCASVRERASGGGCSTADWEEDQKGRAAADPDPPIQENAALSGEQKADDHAESEESDGILFLQPDAGNYAEPEPITPAALDGEDGEIGTTHPQIGFEAVGAEQDSIGKILWRDEDGDSAQEERETASAEFAGEDGRLHCEKRRSQRGNETNAPERISGTALQMRIRNGMSGGWSTYPQAR